MRLTTFTQSGALGHASGWTNFSHAHYHRVHGFRQIFNVSLDLLTICFAPFSRCRAFFVSSCYFVLESCYLFCGDKLSITSFCSIYPAALSHLVWSHLVANYSMQMLINDFQICACSGRATLPQFSYDLKSEVMTHYDLCFMALYRFIGL